jgi:CubicO group peptidase (beta-lactamase class C family)
LISCNVIKGTKDLNGEIASRIDSIRIAHNIPSITYGVIKNDTILVMNTVGYLDFQTKEKAKPGNYYNIGSNTKAFTGFLAAKLVEDNLIKWDTKFFDLYPELKKESNSAYYNITLKELLSHRARMINFNQPEEIITILSNYLNNIDESLTLPKRRYYVIKEILKYEPLPSFEKCKNSYSNAGFIAAALMLEKVTGQSWERLIMKLSKDLKLNFFVGSPIDLDFHQPKGHLNPKDIGLDSDEDLIPIQVPVQISDHGEPSRLNLLFEFLLLGNPAGNISINVNDFLKFLQLNIEGINGFDNYLKSKTYKQIYFSYPDYSIGWGVMSSGKAIYYHEGSNMMFNSCAKISPNDNLGIVVMMNAYNHNAIIEILNLLETSFTKK